MLTKFKVNRFRGFNKMIEWDLSHPSSYEYNTNAIKNGIIKNGIVFGPNGSGKSNLSMAIFDIINHLTQKYKQSDYYHNFINAETPDQLVDFEYSFRFGDTELEYSYSKIKDGRLVKERLYVDGKRIIEKQNTYLFVDPESFPMNDDTRNSLAMNVNSVSVLYYLSSIYPLEANHYLIKLRDFVDGMLWFVNLDVRRFMGLESSVYNLDEFIIKQKLVGDFEIFLNEISGQQYRFLPPQKNDRTLMCSFGKYAVPFLDIASTGTRSLQLLFFWLQRLNKATFVFIDEFDAFYHFDLSKSVCKRLFNFDCQVFTSSHNTSLMTNDLLRPDCCFILDNNQIKPFFKCTNKELRFAHNLEKLYRGGALEV